jgi:hypothetical protein
MPIQSSVDGSSRDAPLSNLEAAASLVSALPSGAKPVSVFLSGICAVTAGSRSLFESHSHIAFSSYSDGTPAIVSGGISLPASAFSLVTDAAILAQLPPNARGQVYQLDLNLNGIDGNAGPLLCREYAGGNACILPGVYAPAGLELFWDDGAGDTAPLNLARFPNVDVSPLSWPTMVTASKMTFTTDAAVTPKLPAWSQQLQYEGLDSAMIHLFNPDGWADMHFAIGSVNVSGKAITLEPCLDPGATLQAKSWWYAYNLLAELDTPGEYKINRTSNM